MTACTRLASLAKSAMQCVRIVKVIEAVFSSSSSPKGWCAHTRDLSRKRLFCFPVPGCRQGASASCLSPGEPTTGETVEIQALTHRPSTWSLNLGTPSTLPGGERGGTMPEAFMAKYKVDQLDGAMLDLAVAHATEAWKFCHEWFPTMTLDSTFVGAEIRGGICGLVPRNPMRQDFCEFKPSSCWSQGGRLLEKFSISISTYYYSDSDSAKQWFAESDDFNFARKRSDRPLIAVARCIVVSRKGEEVELP